MAILLKREDVQRLLDMPSTIEILEQAFAELSAGRVNMPQRTVINAKQVPSVALWRLVCIARQIYY